MIHPRQIELLAPAKNSEIAIEAIKHGADAVYIGAPTNGARAAAANTISDIATVVRFAHLFNARVYVTVNTIIYESELKAVEKMIRELYKIGVDALIVQDMSVLKMDIPPIALHASTQCDIRTPEKAEFLEAAGFSQIVPARELSLKETAEICAAVNIPVEVFVHGALCVSYSGACYSSLATTGRSANRGECAQICRLPYTLYDCAGKELIKEKHLLSLRDLNRIADLEQLLTAGVSSFKIEGRLKDATYVKNVVTAYRTAIDSIIGANPQLYSRSSSGTVNTSFIPDLSKSFNRGYTSYFTHTPAPKQQMASFESPKWTGEKIGTVRTAGSAFLVLDTKESLSNGDGLGYFNTKGKFCGFRVNRTEGNKVFPASPISIKPHTEIFRNNNKSWNDRLSADTATRTIAVE
ncbi:MAG: U32 family peptidase, partial [Paramuribaculum sp.]|nr:U32 family peptidase [Paramuribaculum sp.]